MRRLRPRTEERIAVVPRGAGETVTQLTTRAASLNSERVVPGGIAKTGRRVAAAAAAGAICGEAGPRAPSARAALGDRAVWLPGTVRAKWTPSGRGRDPGGSWGWGGVLGDRGVTTRTKTGSGGCHLAGTDHHLVVDDVIPSIRAALGAKVPLGQEHGPDPGGGAIPGDFGAGGRWRAEIITRYDGVTAPGPGNDPRCAW